MFEKEYRKLLEIQQKAMDFIYNMNYRAARKVLRKLDSSFMVSEANQIRIEVEASILCNQNKFKEARDFVCDSLYEVWGNPFTWMITRQINKEVHSESKTFFLEFGGSAIMFGSFPAFPGFISSFDVVASSKESAEEYIRDVIQFESPEQVVVLTAQEQGPVPLKVEHEGILIAHPFRTPNTENYR